MTSNITSKITLDSQGEVLEVIVSYCADRGTLPSDVDLTSIPNITTDDSRVKADPAIQQQRGALRIVETPNQYSFLDQAVTYSCSTQLTAAEAIVQALAEAGYEPVSIARRLDTDKQIIGQVCERVFQGDDPHDWILANTNRRWLLNDIQLVEKQFSSLTEPGQLARAEHRITGPSGEVHIVTRATHFVDMENQPVAAGQQTTTCETFRYITWKNNARGDEGHDDSVQDEVPTSALSDTEWLSEYLDYDAINIYGTVVNTLTGKNFYPIQKRHRTINLSA